MTTQCLPNWYKPPDQTTCPFGEVWLGSITRPYVWVEGYPGLSFSGVVVNVGFSLMPYIAVVYAALAMLYAIFYQGDQESQCCFTWRIGEKLGATQLWRVRVLQQVAQFLIFCIFVVVGDTVLTLLFKIPEAYLDPNQRYFYFSPRRPDRSCLTSCAMPSSDTFWAMGMLAYLVIASCMSMMMPHLTKERIDPNSNELREYLRLRRGDAGRSTGRDVEMQAAAQPMLDGEGLGDHSFPHLESKYTEKQMMWMGIHPISTSTFVSRVFVATILLGPVPAARINLADASFEQCAVGLVLGLVFACVFHTFWVLCFKNKSRAERFRNLIVGGVMLFRNPFNARLIVAALCSGAAAPGGGGAVEADDPSRYALPAVDPELMEEVPSRLKRDGLLMNVTGFEFMGISTDAEVFVKEIVDQFERERLTAEGTRRAHLQNLVRRQHDQLKKVAEIPPQITDKTTKGNIEDLDRAIKHSIETLSQLEQSSAGDDALEQSFRNLKKLVEPTLAEARGKHRKWVILSDRLKLAIAGKKHALAQPGDPKKRKRLLHQTADKVYTAFAECISGGIAVHQLLTDDRTRVTEEVKNVLREWQGAFSQAAHRSQVDRAQLYNSLLDKVTMTEDNEDYGDFCFTDLDRCLRIIRLLPADETLKICSAELGKRKVKEIRQFLEKFKDLTQFLGYLEKERIGQTAAQFRARNPGPGGGPDKLARELMADICREYEDQRPEVVSSADMKSAIADPLSVLDIMRGRRGRDGPLGVFQDIFVNLAELRIARYGVLVAPHLPQLVLLLMFKEFLRRGGEAGSLKTLIAQVGTGEGKSMLIACLASYVVLSSKNGAGRYEKKVHVVGNDERLVSRDFGEFEELFASCFGRDAEHAMMLRKDDKITDDVYKKVWSEDMHIIFCLPHHIALLYSREAKGTRDFSRYDNCVLLLDEVDSLIVDDSPNAPILYNSWTKQGREGRAQTARNIAEQFGHADLLQDPAARKPTERDYREEGEKRICREVRKFWNQSRPENYKGLAEKYEAPGELDEYVKKDKDGKPDHLLQDNLLEVLNFRYKMESERKAPAEMRWLERGFIVSKPWCFTKYSKILGFSGTTGNRQEEDFIRNVYDAQIIRAPAFLDCCEQKEKHEVEWSTQFQVPVDTDAGEVRHSNFVVVDSEVTQASFVAKVAIAACEKVPVLVIARDVSQADFVLRRLRSEAARKLKDFPSNEVVQDLTARVFERSAGEYRSILTRATERAGPDPDDQFRITVTDKSGGRGTDYRMDDVVADSHGGLLVVMMHIPLEERDWVQNRGRTARQDRRGQIVAVLQQGDYDLEPLPPAEGEEGSPAKPLPEELYRGGVVVEDPEGAKDAILRYGQRLSQVTMARVGREFAAGMHANNLCEKFWAHAGTSAPRDTAANERFLQLLRTYSTRSIEDMNGHMTAIIGRDIRKEPGWRFATVGTNVPPQYQDYAAEVIKPSKKIFVFCLDISGSMAGSRLNTCKRSLVEMMRNHTSDDDIRTLVPFNDQTGNKFVMWPNLTEDAFAEKVDSLRAGGQTEMKYAMKKCIDHLNEQRAEVARKGEFQPIPCFIVLTDGEDGSEEAPDGSRVAKVSAEEISSLLTGSAEPPYVFGCITLGDVGTSDADMEAWCRIVNEKQGKAFKKSATCSSESIEETFAFIGEGLALDDEGIAVD